MICVFNTVKSICYALGVRLRGTIVNYIRCLPSKNLQTRKKERLVNSKSSVFAESQSQGKGKQNTVDIYSSAESHEVFLEDEQKLARERAKGEGISGSGMTV